MELSECDDWREKCLERDNVIIDLKAEIERQKDQVEKTRREGEFNVEQIKEEMERKREKKKKWKAKVQELKIELNEKDVEMHAKLKEKDKIHQVELRSLNEALVEGATKMTESRQKNDKYVKELLQKIASFERGSIVDMKNTIKNIVDWKVESLQSTRIAIRTAQEDANTEARELKKKVTVMETAHTKTQNNVSALTFQLNEERGRHGGLEKQIKELRELLELASQDVRQANEVNNHYKTANEQLTEQLRTAREGEIKARSEVEELRKEVTRYQQLFVEATDKAAQLTEVQGELKAEIATLKEANLQLESQRAALEEKYHPQLKELTTLKEVYQKRSIELEESIRRLHQETKERIKWEKAADKAKGEYDACHTDLACKQSKVDALESQIITVQSQLMVSQTNVNELQSSLSSTSDENRLLRNEAGKESEAKEKVEKLAASLQATIDELNKDIAGTQEELESARAAFHVVSENKENDLKTVEKWSETSQHEIELALDATIQQFSGAGEEKCPERFLKTVTRRVEQSIAITKLIVESLPHITNATADLGCIKQSATRDQVAKASLHIVKTRDNSEALEFLWGENKTEDIKQHLEDLVDELDKMRQAEVLEKDRLSAGLKESLQKTEMLTKIRDEHLLTINTLNKKHGEVMATNHNMQGDVARFSEELAAAKDELNTRSADLKETKKRNVDMEKDINEKKLTIKTMESDAYLQTKRGFEVKLALKKERGKLDSLRKRFKQRSGKVLESMVQLKREHADVKSEAQDTMKITAESFKATVAEIIRVVETSLRSVFKSGPRVSVYIMAVAMYLFCLL
ncbi:hypothetical protein BSKO_10013 [Bryopsis sp. KO-2023]|nr:hypothetical protein BSKO_10013 [Bryopsis sp. KO-2023]